MGKKLFVGNLAFALTEQSINEKFSNFGTVDSIKIITDRESGRSKGFAFVEMSQDSEAQMAIESLNGQDFGGRNVVVNEAKPMEARSDRGFRSSDSRRSF